MEVVSKITLLFAAFGAITGCVFVPLPGGPTGFLAGLGIFFGVFYLTYRLTPMALGIKPAEFPGGKRKIATTGFFPFFIMWLMLWIMVYTISVSS